MRKKLLSLLWIALIGMMGLSASAADFGQAQKHKAPKANPSFSLLTEKTKKDAPSSKKDWVNVKKDEPASKVSRKLAAPTAPAYVDPETLPNICIGDSMYTILEVANSETRELPEGFQLYRLVAPVNGILTVQSYGDYDTYAALFNAALTQCLAYDDDGGDNTNFLLQYNVKRNTTYYIGIRRYNGDAITDPVRIVTSIENTEVPIVIPTFEHGEIIVTRDGEQLHTGDLVNGGELLHFEFDMEIGYEVTVWPVETTDYIVDPTHYTAGQLVLPVPEVGVVAPTLIDYSYDEQERLVLTWDNLYDNYRVLVSTKDDITSLDYVKGYIATTDTTAAIGDLEFGITYYVYIQGSGEDGTRMSQTAVLYVPGYTPCEYYVELMDSYGDGWNGASLTIVQPNLAPIELTLPGGSSQTIPLQSLGDEVSFIWKKGNYDSEAGLRIINAGGNVIYERDDMSSISNGEFVRANVCDAHPCMPAANVQAWISTDSVSISWLGEAEDYLVAVVHKSFPTNAELLANATPVHGHTFVIKDLQPGKMYRALVAADCGDGKISNWQGINVFTDSLIQPVAPMPVQLGYTHTGDFLAESNIDTLYYIGYPKIAYSLELTGDKHVAFTLESDDIDEELVVWTIYQVDNAGLPIDTLVEYAYRNVVLDLTAGKYIAVLLAEFDQYGNYTVGIKEHTPVTPTPATLNIVEMAMNIEDCQLVEYKNILTTGREYSISLSDTTQVMLICSSENGATQLQVSMGDSIVTEAPRQAFVELTPGDYRLKFLLNGDTVFSFAAIKGEVNMEATPISIGCAVNDHVDHNGALVPAPIPGLPGMTGKLYSLTVERDTSILAGVYIPNYENNEIFMACVMDTTLMFQHARGISVNDFDSYDLKGGRTYYFSVFSSYVDFDFTLHVQDGMTYFNKLNYELVAIDTDVLIEVNQDDQYGKDNWWGYVKPYAIAMEEGKSYQIWVEAENPQEDYQEVKITLFGADTLYRNWTSNRIVYNQYGNTRNYDRTTVVTLAYTADTTAIFPLVIQDWVELREQPYRLHLRYSEAKTFQQMLDEAPVVDYTDYTLEADCPHYVDEVLMDYSHDFASDLYEFSSVAAVCRQIVVPVGDSIYIEALGNEDVRIYLYDTIRHISMEIDEVEGAAFPAELFSEENAMSEDINLFVIVATAMEQTGDVHLTLKMSNSKSALEPEIVAMHADRDEVEVESLTTVEVMAALREVQFSAVGVESEVVIPLSGEVYWTIDWDNLIATAEFNNSDLPLGYSLAADREFVSIAIVEKEPEGISIIEANSDITRKFMMGGRLYIQRDGRIYDMMGTLVK